MIAWQNRDYVGIQLTHHQHSRLLLALGQARAHSPALFEDVAIECCHPDVPIFEPAWTPWSPFARPASPPE